MTSTVICFHSGLLIFCNSSKLAMKQNIIQICNCIYIYIGLSGYRQTKSIPGGWWGRGGSTGRERGSGSDNLSAGRAWK